MATFVALLRGVNVGKAKRVPMEVLRSLLAGLGYGDVKTLLNSGNAVFQARGTSGPAHAKAVASAILENLGVEVPVIVKSAKQLAAIIDENPFASVAADHSRLLVAFTQDKVNLSRLGSIGALATPPEDFAVGKHAAYLHCAAGILESKAAAALLGRLGKAATTRNWATTLKLHALASDEASQAWPAVEVAMTGPSTIDEYIASAPVEVQHALESIRAAVRKAAPGAVERISYRMPAFFLGGALVYFAAFKKHIGFYPPVRAESLQPLLVKYAGPKGNLQFPLSEPMPHALIAKVVKARIKENLAARSADLVARRPGRGGAGSGS